MIPTSQRVGRYGYGNHDADHDLLNERGNTFIDRGGKGKVSAMLAGLGHMLKHYCETGEMLKAAAS